MYKYIIRPILFLLSPETVHHMVVVSIKFFYKIPGIKWFVSKLCSFNKPGLQRKLFGLTFMNPVGLAAGFDKNAEFYNEFSSFGFSFIEIGTVTPEGQPGNEKPRSFRLPKDKALVNRMGFNNKGAGIVVKNLQKKRQKNLIIGGNLGKNTLTSNQNAAADYRLSFEKLLNYVDYFVINVSCPNISDLTKLQDKDSLMKIVETLTNRRKELSSNIPVLLKISPDLNFSQIDDVLEIVNSTGLDGIIATNTSVSRENLSTSYEKIENIGKGGLSGNPIKDKSTAIIKYISQKTNGKLPIIGVGGILTPEDAIEKLEAGASLVQVYTGFIYSGPMLVKKINKKILQNQK